MWIQVPNEEKSEYGIVKVLKSFVFSLALESPHGGLRRKI